MSVNARGDVTTMLSEIRAGVPDAKDRLIRAVYDELMQTARGLMRRERSGHTLEPGALVNEALVRLLSGEALPDLSDGHNLRAAAAQAMRQVLVDHAVPAQRRQARRPADPGSPRRRPRDIRRAGTRRDRPAPGSRASAQDYPRQAQVVTLRFFGGMSVPQVVATLGVSDTTVETDWRFARASACAANWEA